MMAEYLAMLRIVSPLVVALVGCGALESDDPIPRAGGNLSPPGTDDSLLTEATPETFDPGDEPWTNRRWAVRCINLGKIACLGQVVQGYLMLDGVDQCSNEVTDACCSAVPCEDMSLVDGPNWRGCDLSLPAWKYGRPIPDPVVDVTCLIVIERKIERSSGKDLSH